MAWLRAPQTLALVALAGLFAARPGRAAPLDPAFTETPLLAPRGMAGTTAMAWAPDGSNRLFYTRQLGHVYLVDNGALKHFLALPAYNSSECGVLGLAFDPNFVVNHFVYVFFTSSFTEQQIIRYSIDGNLPKDPKVIVSGLPTRGVNHDAGSLGLGPDGKLYWSIGDLGNGTGAKDDLTSPAAKVSRANLDGSAPEDNPFYDASGPNDDRIWARGFRNPFTFTWQPATDQLWVNSVGNVAEQAFIVRAGDNAGWNSFENNQPSPYISPVISYPTKGAGASTIAAGGAMRANGIATFTTTAAHGLRRGGRVTIAAVGDASFNGSGFVSDVASPTSFSLAQAGADALASGGTATPLDLGNAITGGTFWDSSSVPAAYRGNYFFGDYVSGNIARVTLAADNQVTSADLWAVGAGHMIDMAVGPDGDLYYATFDGAFYHIRYNATEQGIVVSQLHTRVAEGGQAVFSVRLATQPAAPVSVAIERTAGDADVSTEEDELTFDGSNWSVPQPVHVAAAQDDDAAQDTAELTLSSPGLESELVEVRVTDDDPLAILVSPSALSLVEGSSAEVAVTLNGPPASALDVAIEAPSLGIDPDTLSFAASNWSTPHALTVSAARAHAPLTETLKLSARNVASGTLEVTVTPPEPSGASGAGASGASTSATGGAGGVADAAVGFGAAEGTGGHQSQPSGGESGGGESGRDTSSKDDGGCSCHAVGTTTPSVWSLSGPLALAAWLLHRRRRLHSTGSQGAGVVWSAPT